MGMSIKVVQIILTKIRQHAFQLVPQTFVRVGNDVSLCKILDLLHGPSQTLYSSRIASKPIKGFSVIYLKGMGCMWMHNDQI